MIYLIFAVVALAALIAYIHSRPSDFTVSVDGIVGAPPASVFPYINDLHLWEQWSPWARMDPDAKTTYDGPRAGAGAGMGWEGKKTGAGHMTITESQPDSQLAMRLDFTRPFKATNTVDFVFVPEREGTRVTWTMHGKSNFISKAMGLVMDCEGMVGKQYRQGLANLNEVVRRSPDAARAA